MIDPFQADARRERITQAVGLVLLIALLCALALFWVRTDVSNGRVVEATVVRLGNYPDPLGTGDSPILTVRLPDGSIRQLRASWPAVDRCAPGSKVSILQRGTALKVGYRGCRSMP